MNKIQELTGIIISKEPRKVYKRNEFYGQQNWRLKVWVEKGQKYSDYQNYFVYTNLVNSQILNTIQQSQYIDKRYLLIGAKKPKGWVLHDWKELQSNVSDLAKSRQLPDPLRPKNPNHKYGERMGSGVEKNTLAFSKDKEL